MRVAICFAGMPYYIRQNKDYWLELIHRYRADVYASLWDEEKIYQDEDTIDYFKKVYNPVSIEAENQKALIKSFRFLAEEYKKSPDFFDEPKHFAHINSRLYSTLYKIWRANLLPSLAGKKYDVIVRAETCSSYPDMEIVQENNLSIPHWHHIFNLGGYNSSNINNWLAFGPPDIMDYYSSCFLKLRKYYDECFAQPVESFLNYHLFQRPNIELRLFNSRIYRKGVLNWNGKQQADDNTNEVSKSAWYINVKNLGKDFDTSISSHANSRDLDLHEMETAPIENSWPRKGNTSNQEESGYQTIHKFCPYNKAKNDSNCGVVKQDKYGNWIPIYLTK